MKSQTESTPITLKQGNTAISVQSNAKQTKILLEVSLGEQIRLKQDSPHSTTALDQAKPYFYYKTRSRRASGVEPKQRRSSESLSTRNNSQPKANYEEISSILSEKQQNMSYFEVLKGVLSPYIRPKSLKNPLKIKDFLNSFNKMTTFGCSLPLIHKKKSVHLNFSFSLSGLEIIITDSTVIEQIKTEIGAKEEEIVRLSDILEIHLGNKVKIVFAETKPFHSRGCFQEEIQNILELESVANIPLDSVEKESYMALHLNCGRDIPELQAYFLAFYPIRLDRDVYLSHYLRDITQYPLRLYCL